jgi:hypothetical protein
VCLLRGTDWMFNYNSGKSTSSGSNKQQVKGQTRFVCSRMTGGVAVACGTAAYKFIRILLKIKER